MASRKISFIGAGSSVFTAQLVSDFLATEGRDGGTFGLVDITAIGVITADLNRQAVAPPALPGAVRRWFLGSRPFARLILRRPR
jgi:hypothetical protein